MKTIIGCLMLLTTFHLSTAQACNCAEPPEDPVEAVTKAYEQSSIVFLGRAIRVSRPQGKDEETGQMIEVGTFRVQRMWKGVYSEELTSRIDIKCCTCGVSFNEGREYLIFGYQRSDGSFSTSICSGPMLNDGSAISILDELYPHGT
ncbi:MAG: hypothetical protein WD081_04155 [Gammaproteobacteria bacterium]